jgi:hypothetical protein
MAAKKKVLLPNYGKVAKGTKKAIKKKIAKSPFLKRG